VAINEGIRVFNPPNLIADVAVSRVAPIPGWSFLPAILRISLSKLEKIREG